ncbi:flagellar hook-basal body complex protein [Opitutus sp. ER46]|uniref:flagellar hook-basal body protein n=1 Tax=Opitutus sp. ER46 TaxID=2161864 RepID=UPI000D2FC6E9|nr:flagellar hook-basal body complex protein [Opitutus sp. ER46]PTX90904.1 flagellar hook-basal body protein [Opitutus sp. ER46]
MSLLGTLTSGVSALKTFGKSLEVIGTNISNVNTTAYKGSSANFADTFSNTLRAASTTDSAVQIGTGVQLAGINTNFTQGSMTSTGSTTDLAVSGNGYFVVQDGSGVNYATRDGSFHFDNNGFLVNAQGYNVLDSAGAKVQAIGADAGGTAVSYADLKSVSIGSDGTLTAFASDGTATASGKVGLLNITDQPKLMKVGNNLFDFGSTGAVVADIGVPTSNGLGKIQSGQLELSNVDLTEQFANLITSQRSFQAASRLITVSDTVLEDIVNLKR